MQTRNLKSKQRFTVTLLISASLLLLNLNVAAGRPDVRQSPFALELQPPLLEVEAFNAANKRAIDSYGNPIDALRPIQTPDGRKVVSAEGVQFEIPNYASGITEIRKPADDLLPPHIVRFDAPDSSTDSQKIEYTKSDDGKVITSTRKEAQANSVFQTTAPAVVAAPAVNTGKYTGGFGAPPGLLRPQNQENKPDIYVAGNNHEFGYGVKANRGRPAQAANGGRYTGGFGAPSGVLSAQQAPRPFQAAQQSTPQLVAEASSNQQSRFGGPPGVLVPFDNVQ
ncbi:uncharacterized protein LOC108596985 isoform X6 [Drosophila busckii]|uniref:uncharacterized protein LOC108596985 isoform X6 n=1 Tax=Drosophila busckii TaxID=30019 RepID=UPI001432BEC4|nr:uncharacterized protein LOC108596985 isoform X6 [Drosophila busckii]